MAILNNKYDIFISYARKDDEDFVKRLYTDLSSHGYKVWYDNSNSLESNGVSFLQNIRDALAENPIRLLLVIGPHAAKSKYVEAEWRFALENCQIIIPILRVGQKSSQSGNSLSSDEDYELMPETLRRRRLDCINFRQERQYEDALNELLHDLSKDLKKLAELNGVINKPKNYVDRGKEIENIKDLLVKDAINPTVITSVSKAVTIQGMGGIGKSVLAAAVCQDCDIRRSFHDGIYWVVLGQKPNIQNALRYITGDATIDYDSNPQSARDCLKNFLKQKNCLIVLDDVWTQEHLEVFTSDEVLRCRLLVTTRNKQTIKHLSESCVEIDLLCNNDALLLLSKACDKSKSKLPAEAEQIIKECGNLPLAVNMIGGMIKAGDDNTWKYALEMLQAADLKEITQQFPDYPYPDLFKAIDVSVNFLNDKERVKYLQLGIFRENSRVPEDVIHLLWQSDSWQQYKTNKLLSSFVERGILQRIETAVYGLHDLQLDYIRMRVGVELAALHSNFIEKLGNPLHLSHAYLWQNYVWHLLCAGERTTATKLLGEYRWIEAKLFNSGIFSLIDDYAILDSRDPTVETIFNVLKKSRHILAAAPEVLPSQIIARWNIETDEDRRFVQSIAPKRIHKWMEPLSPSLYYPDTLLYTWQYVANVIHSLSKTQLLLISYSDIAIFSTEDFTLKKLVFESHQSRIESAKVSNDGTKVFFKCEKSLYGYDLNAEELFWRFSHDKVIHALEFDSRLNKLLFVDDEKSVYIYDFRDSSVKQLFQGGKEFDKYSLDIAFKNVDEIVIAPHKNYILIVGAITGELIRRVEFEEEIYHLKKKKQGFIACFKTHISWLDNDFTETDLLEVQGEYLNTYTDDYFLVKSGSYQVDLYCKNKKLVKAFHTNNIIRTATMIPGNIVVTSEGHLEDRILRFWKVEEGKSKQLSLWYSFDNEFLGEVTAVTASSDGKYIAFGTRPGLLLLLDFHSMDLLASVEAHPPQRDFFGWGYGISSILFNDEENIVTCSTDGYLKHWEIIRIETSEELSYRLRLINDIHLPAKAFTSMRNHKRGILTTSIETPVRKIQNFSIAQARGNDKFLYNSIFYPCCDAHVCIPEYLTLRLWRLTAESIECVFHFENPFEKWSLEDSINQLTDLKYRDTTLKINKWNLDTNCIDQVFEFKHESYKIDINRTDGTLYFLENDKLLASVKTENEYHHYLVFVADSVIFSNIHIDEKNNIILLGDAHGRVHKLRFHNNELKIHDF
jgi:WD40 repeat protein